ncbi:disulfide bond formation protein DsbA [Nitrosopumilus oxyclinae]|uniref:Disulfide bond formation protein DsbA n=1 Tax=Nitrosopumilus oxyclinae TaxID=1959104 RepID=A0A7D5M6L0_9ARCH|nr:DsbA family protein [Nitrosopumilus oxyclinae]QLH05608.1 disulfide bond formation protein DsbA [Nitrosopumilus oxyclinae]
MSLDDSEINHNNNEKISVKKSTFNGLLLGIIILVGVSAFFAGSYTSNLNSNQISTEDLDEAMAKLELKLLQNQLPTKQVAEPVKISMDDDPIIGNPDAPITIIEFSDFQCPFCARFHIQTLPLLLEEYIESGKVKLVFRDFPIQSIHPNALPASVAAECANDQNKFREMHDTLFENQNNWNNLETIDALSLFSQYASDIQLDQESFDLCLNSGKHIPEIQNDLNDGRDYGVSGTPGFFVGNDQIGFVELKGAQPFESFKKVIDAQLNS